MKIICKSGNSNDVQILSNTGENLSKELNIRKIDIKFLPDEQVVANFECYVGELHLQNITKCHYYFNKQIMKDNNFQRIN